MTLRHREIKQLVQDHTATERCNWDLNTCGIALGLSFLISTIIGSQYIFSYFYYSCGHCYFHWQMMLPSAVKWAEFPLHCD